MLTGTWQHRTVNLNGRDLSPERSLKLINHSPDGFAWGYAGSGPAQLALAILLEFTTEQDALTKYQQFKWDVIAPLPMADFTLPSQTITNWLANH